MVERTEQYLVRRRKDDHHTARPQPTNSLIELFGVMFDLLQDVYIEDRVEQLGKRLNRTVYDGHVERCRVGFEFLSERGVGLDASPRAVWALRKDARGRAQSRCDFGNIAPNEPAYSPENIGLPVLCRCERFEFTPAIVVSFSNEGQSRLR